ncbi:hypothetical protein ACFL2C_02420 [Patescibacteria group bacterium]
MKTDATPEWGTVAYKNMRKRQLMPPAYSGEIRSEAGRLLSIRPTLTRPQASALAASNVLNKRLDRISGSTDLNEPRMGPVAKMNWVSKQLSLIENNHNYLSAIRK